MDDILSTIPLFVEVARRKSFTKASEILDIPVSTVSRRIARMEKTLGVTLLARSSRHVELTENGRIFFEFGEEIVGDIQGVCETLHQDMQELSGVIHLSIYYDSYNYLFPCFDSFMSAWPKIQLKIRFADRGSDPVTEPYDLEFRLGALPDSSLKVRHIASAEYGLYASPVFLEKYGVPKVPADLEEMPCIVFTPIGNKWFFAKGGQQTIVEVGEKVGTTSMRAALDFARAGHGAIYSWQILAFQFEKAGELIRLLPEWDTTETEISIVMPNRKMPKRVRLFIDHMIAYLEHLEREMKNEMEKR